MFKKTVKLTGLLMMTVLVALLSFWPAAAYAALTFDCVFNGTITLDGNNVNQGTITGSIEGKGEWNTAISTNSMYSLRIPFDNGSGNGGKQDDVVHFKININGMVLNGKNGTFVKGGEVWLAQALTTPVIPQITTESLPDGEEGTPGYSVTLSAMYGTLPYTWTASGLPAGLTIGAGTGIISGTPGASGDFNVTVTVTDSAVTPASGSRNYPLHINPAPIPLSITTNSLDNGRVGVLYSATLEASGGIPGYSWSATGLPAGLAIGTATGVINGNPAVSGNHSVEVTVTDSANPANSISKSFNLEILEPFAPLTILTSEMPRWAVEVFPDPVPAGFLPLPPPGWIIDQPYSADMQATGGNGNYIWSATNLPPGLTMTDGGIISGAPTVDGLYDIIFNVRDTQDPPFTAAPVTLQLKIYLIGDANGEDGVSVADVTYCQRAILGLNAPTAGCDANLSLELSIADPTKIQRIILGLP